MYRTTLALSFFLALDLPAAGPRPDQFAMWLEQVPPTDVLVVLGWEEWSIQSFSYGICMNSDEVAVDGCGPLPVVSTGCFAPACSGLSCPADLLDAIPGVQQPDFVYFAIERGGFIHGVVFDFFQEHAVPPRERFETLRIRYRLNAPSTQLRFCSGVLGAPPADVAVVVDGGVYQPARQDGLTLTPLLIRRVPSPYATIQEAVDAAEDGDTVLLAPGEYVITEPIDFNRLHDPADPASPAVKNLVLRSEGTAEETIIRMSSAPADPARANVFVFEHGESALSRVENVTITGGAGSAVVPGTPHDRRGGGILCAGGAAPAITGCRLVGNSAAVGAAVAMQGGVSTISNCTISGNAGSAIAYLGGTHTLTDCVIASNGQGYWGGGVLCERANVRIADCSITGNSSSAGGGVGLRSAAVVTLERCEVRGNTAVERGGGIMVWESTATLADCTIADNRAYSHGGGIDCEGSSVRATRCTFATNTADYGGGVCYLKCMLMPDVALDDCAVVGNWADWQGGGGIFVQESRPSIANCSIRGNGTGEWGGGIKCAYMGFAEVTNCVVLGNSARHGGGIGCDGADSLPTINYSTIAGNAGGGVSFSASAPVPVLKNCIVWYNAGGAGLPYLEARYSCVEGAEALYGNNGKDPRFRGWGANARVYVDATNPQSGDGAPENPYASLDAALQFGLALAPDSPCWTMGETGGRIGANTGGCDAAGETARIVHVAAGAYALRGWSLACNVSVEGAGQDKTVLRGLCFGARTGATLRALTVADGTQGGFVAAPQEAPRLEDCTFRNHAGPSAVECDNASPTFVRCAITGNYPTVDYSVFCHDEAAPLFQECLVAGNVNAVHSVNSSPRFDRCVVTRNTVSFTLEGRTGTTTLDACEVIGNGLGLESLRATVRCTNCVFAGNASLALRVADGGALLIANCTIADNNDTFGSGGIACAGGSARLANTILWHNGPDNGCGDRVACLVGPDPRFVDTGSFDFSRFTTLTVGNNTERLPDFVVRAPDYRLQPDSPAISGGASADAPAYDIEGNARPCGGGGDIGAYESCTVLFVRGDANADSMIDLGDAIATISYLFEGLVLPCVTALDANDDSAIDTSDAIFTLYYLFRRGSAPTAPFVACGPDPTPDSLACDAYPPCAGGR